MKQFEDYTVSEIERKLFYLDKREKSVNGKRVGLLKKFQKEIARQTPICIEQIRFSLARHFYYCDRRNTPYEVDAVHEILADAAKGRFEAYTLQIELEDRKYAMPYNPDTSFMSKLFQKSRAKGKTPVIA